MDMKPKLQHTVVGIHIPNRFEHATEVQKVLTEYGCSIKTRLGLHEVNTEYCAINGLILLEMYGPEKDMEEMIGKLNALDAGIDVQQMIFKMKM
jgi:hypothetical protein